MTCEEVEREEVAERYVLGRLETGQQQAFEDHYFNCSACLERVQIVEETSRALTRDATRPRMRRWPRVTAGLAAAAALVLALRLFPSSEDPGTVNVPPAVSPSKPGPPPLAESAGAISLPRYTPPQLRSTPPEAQRVFRDAMEPYSTGNCDSAVTGLRRVVQMDESLLSARFYLAACELYLGRTQNAEDQLHRVVAAGESPYLEDAHFFLAKSRIRQGDMEGARAELTRVIAMKGERLEEAERLLQELR